MVLKRVLCCCLMALLPAAFFQDLGAVTVDPATKYQTVEAIGCLPSIPALCQKAGKFYQDRPTTWEFDRMCIDLGITGMRLVIPTEAIYLARGKYDWMGIKGYVDVLRQCKQREVDRYIITILNPPGWAKTNGRPEQGGNLLPGEYDGMAEFIAQMCKAFKDSVGVEPYGVCVQNEPSFPEPYGSCVYSDADFSRLSSLTKARLTPLGLTTRLYGPADVCNMGLDWPTVQQNPDISAYAIHNECGNWDAAASYAKAGSKALWQNEWDCAADNEKFIKPSDYMKPGGMLMNALKAGLSYWLWYGYSNNLGGGKQGTDLVDTMWVPDKRYYATKMFSRFIRKDAVRIGCTGSNALAFKNPDNSIAVIFVNGGGAATESIGGTGLPATWHVYRTSATENCVYVGESNGSGISVPSASIVSAISGSKVPEIPADVIPYRVAEPAPDLTVGKLNARGDDVLRVWINGVEVPGEQSATTWNQNNSVNKRMVSIKQGENVVACWVRNIAWGGGLLASMMLPGGDTLHSDATWKVTVADPTRNAAWNTVGYDDSGWRNAFPVGDVMAWPGFARWGSQAVSLYYQGAQNILGGDHVYFRKKITFTQAVTNFYIRGNNFKYKIYVDGELKKEGTEFTNCTPKDPTHRCFDQPAVQIAINAAAGTTNTFALDIEDANKDGNGVLMKAGFTRAGLPITMDTTWWCSDNAPAGWNTAAYSDTTTWSRARIIEAYDVAAGAGNFIFPGDFWFRKKFTSKEGTRVIGLINSLLNRDAVVSVKYFTLQGREFKGAVRALSGPRTTLVERRTYRSGRVEEVKVMRTARTAR